MGENALETLQQVLRIVPGHPRAIEKLKGIGEKYKAWAEARIRAKQWKRAEEYLAKARQVVGENPEIADLLAYVRKQIEPELPPPPPAKASLVIVANVGGAVIEVDGARHGRTSRGRGVVISDLSPGTHNIRLSVRGYKDFERTVRLGEGKRHTLPVDLVAVGPPSAAQQIGRGLDTMVKVPGGGFTMGSNDNYEREKPQRRVYLDAFYIDKYPVTNARFRRFGRPDYDAGTKFNGARQPVVGVMWTQARDYCGSVGERLPTEAEWEKAARGVDGRKYSWGNDWADGSKVIWRKNSGGKMHPVDRTYNTHRSPYGAVDMSGNVWEWVADWYKGDYYQNAPSRNPKGPASGTWRVVRGGSWYFINPTHFRTAARGRDHSVDRGNYLGFRCAKAP